MKSQPDKIPTLDCWKINTRLTGHFCIEGCVSNHTTFKDGAIVITRDIKHILDEELVVTDQGAGYLLGDTYMDSTEIPECWVEKARSLGLEIHHSYETQPRWNADEEWEEVTSDCWFCASPHWTDAYHADGGMWAYCD